MSQKQSWPLSQDANKASGTCSCCRATGQLHLKDGTLHLHGPRKNRCPGSNKPPLNPQPLLASTQPSVLASASSSPSAPSSQPVQSSTAATVTSNSISSTGSSFSKLAHPRLSVPTIKHIPKSARPACGNLLSKSLDKITANPNDLAPWTALLNFGHHILLQPPRTGKRHNLAAIIKKRTAVEEHDDQPGDHMGYHRKRDPAAQLAAAIMAKVEDGNLKAAIRILTSEERPAEDNDITFAKLLERHPAAPADRSQPPDPHNTTAVQMTEAEVQKVKRSFPAGSSGGPDGVRPQHILDLINCRECGTALLTSITGFVNSLLQGKCHPEVVPILFGGNLIAFPTKKYHGITMVKIPWFFGAVEFTMILLWYKLRY